MTAPDPAIARRGAAAQNPMDWCRFRERARPRRPRRGTRARERAGRDHERGHHSTTPVGNQQQEAHGAEARDRAAHVPPAAGRGEPAVDFGDRPEEGAQSRRSVRECATGARVDGDGPTPSEAEGGGGGGVRTAAPPWSEPRSRRPRPRGASRRTDVRRPTRGGVAASRIWRWKARRTPVVARTRITTPHTEPTARCSQKRVVRRGVPKMKLDFNFTMGGAIARENGPVNPR
jgi:hypothetical protein